MEDADWAQTSVCVCVCVCLLRAPLPPVTGCGRRRAEDRSRAAWFDSQTSAGAEDAPVWKSGLSLSPSRDGNTQMRTRSEGKSGRELILLRAHTGARFLC
ncbi:hypothetical protein Q5P01_025463 [Channa striata]|uniref:Uncharacterized protein n=1 Tax=Channa striata TaxID=64152 RepID=A0AA88IIL9_CHASR|nr:hypothetical protein Q5P01_025463 [Channa striata]